MTDKEKLKAIRAEVQNYIDAAHKAHANITEGNFAHLLSFIDSLQEKPISEELIDVAKQYVKEHVIGIDKVMFSIATDMFLSGAKWQKEKDESITEDLGEYINELLKQFPEVSFAKLSRIAVRVAKWQKQQDQSTIELAEDHAMLAGMNRMEEQIMSKAKSGIGDKDNYIKFEDDTWLDLDPTMKLKPAFDIKEGEKVKVLIIKEVNNE